MVVEKVQVENPLNEFRTRKALERLVTQLVDARRREEVEEALRSVKQEIIQ